MGNLANKATENILSAIKCLNYTCKYTKLIKLSFNLSYKEEYLVPKLRLYSRNRGLI
jgi:hypothetical protein